MKTKYFYLLFFSFVLLTVGCGLMEQQPTIIFSHILSEESEWHIGAEVFKENLQEKVKDEIKVRLVTHASLSNNNQRTELEMVQAGTLGGSWESSILLSVIDPRWSVWSMPWLFDSYEEAETLCQSELGQEMLQSLEEKGIMGLAYGFNGFRRLTNSKRPVSTIQDIKDLKIRVPSLQMFISLYRTWEADPTQMNFGDLILALKEGTMDGQENPLHVIRSSGVYETQDYLTLWHYSFDPIVFCVSKKVWDTLSPEHQQAVRESATSAAAEQRMSVIKNEANHLAYLISSGMKISTPTSGAVEAFVEKAEPVFEEYKPIIGEDLFNRFRETTQNNDS